MESLQNRRKFCQLHINEINFQKYKKIKKCKTYISKVPLSHQINQWVNELNIFSKKETQMANKHLQICFNNWSHLRKVN